MMKREFHVIGAGLVAALLLLVLGPERNDLTAKATGSAEGKGYEVVLHLGWGSGLMDAGRRLDPESAPEGPMSFSVTAGGEIHVLDQVNLRILAFDRNGALVSVIPLPGGAFQDIEVALDGRILLLDRLVRRSVVVLDPQGLETAAHAVTGPGIPEGGGITAMFLEDDGLWLEYNHERIVRILDGSLSACARTALQGRKAGSGDRAVLAALAGQGRVGLRLIDTATGSTVVTKEIDLGPDLYRIAWAQADGLGGIHAMVHLVPGGPWTGQSASAEKILALRLDGKLRQTGSFESPFTIRAWEQFREFRVLPAGQVFQMAFLDGGVQILKWRYEP
jgi:hypothetical protein